MVFGIGSAISPAIYGWVRDVRGNYDLALLAASCCFIAGAVVLLSLGPYPQLPAARVRGT